MAIPEGKIAEVEVRPDTAVMENTWKRMIPHVRTGW